MVREGRKMRKAFLFPLIFVLTVAISPGVVMSSAQTESPKMPLVKDSSILSAYQEAQANIEITDEDKIKNVIDTYFKLRYEGQKRLALMDFTSLVEQTPQPQAWAQNELNKREIELYMGINYKLNYLDYEYSLDYQTIQVKDGGQAVVQLKENHNVVFEVSAPEISRMANQEHTITLHRSNEKWVIVSDEYQDELSSLLLHQSKEEIMRNIEANILALGKPSSLIQQDNSYHSIDSISILSTGDWHNLTSTNRNSIANYADTYWSNYNSSYRDFSGVDCTNFVSQAMYEWTPIPMDATGSLLWYYYSGSNYSTSWTVVNNQYSYLSNNTWTGPKGHRIYGLCGLEKADIVQGHNGSYWQHEVVIVKITSAGYCWEMGKYLYDAHDNDRYHYPLTAMAGFSTLRLISLDGYYE
jgi:hypothetical protein